MVLNKLQLTKGSSLVEILIVSAIMLVVFGGLLVSFRYSLELIAHSRAKLTALTLANDGMEYIRSLSYNAVGTVSGIPSGLLPQVSTTTLNGIVFTKRTLVEYIDDDADGLGAADSNGITTDYKQAKVSLSWTLRGVSNEVFLVSNIIPKSIETDVDGGTVRVNVFDFDNAPLPGASVRLVNTTLVPNIDVTRVSDATGVALFGGAPEGGDYEIFVTASGYSTDQTYQATTTLPNPSTLPIGVVESSISTMNFFIDAFSTVDITALTSKVVEDATENFDDSSGIASSSGTTVSGGTLRLNGTAGSYASLGTAYLNPLTPSPLTAWDYLLVTGTTTTNTNARVSVYTGTSSSYTRIPDSDLPGNAAGFALGAVDVSMLDVVAYPSLTVGVTLTSSNVNVTPLVDTVVVAYIESQTPLASQTLTMQGTKSIGTMTDGSLVYKNSLSANTNSQGEATLLDVEGDEYILNTGGYEIREACPVSGLDIEPGTNLDLQLVLTGNTTHSLRVAVETASGLPVIGATVAVSSGGYNDTEVTTGCGQVYFGGIASQTDYQIMVTAPGYTTQTINSISVVGDTLRVITL
ncbi:MAG: carboxypeptidase-like regulatory domain-containing protein [Patescibacteria group bacterium]